MQAQKLQTVVDLREANDGQQRIELIDGEIVKRPMARSEHALTQSDLSGQFSPLSRQRGSGGWWIMTEISMRYSEHHCPVHDLAGWRKDRVPKRPSGIMDVLPDWVCEITSPGHERKDTITHLLRLQACKVPHYWLISLEDKMLIVYALEGEHYRVAFSMEYSPDVACDRLSIPPFDGHLVDLGFIFGVDED